jgi:hypothetical protein
MHRERIFAAVDVAYLAQDTIIELGERFGAVGPLVWLALILDAKGTPKGPVPGVTEGRYAALARRCSTDEATASKVIKAAVEVGLLEAIDLGERRYKVRLLKFTKWEPKDAMGAERQARHRARRQG